MNGVDPGQTPLEFYDFCCATEDGLFSQYASRLLQLNVSSRSFLRDTILDDLIAGGIPPIPAGDLVYSFNEKFRKSKNLGVFWDMENIRPNFKEHSGEMITDALRKRLAIFGEVMEVHCYCDKGVMEGGMSMPGALVHHVPKRGWSHEHEVADKMLIVDALSFAFQYKDPVVCIVSCDSDFSALISKLQMLGVRCISVTKDGAPVRSMNSVSMVNLSWPGDFFSSSSSSAIQNNVSSSSAGNMSQLPTIPRPKSRTPERRTKSPSNTTNNNNTSNLHPTANLLQTGNDNHNNHETSTNAAGGDGGPTRIPRPRSRSPLSNNTNNKTPLFTRFNSTDSFLHHHHHVTPAVSFSENDVDDSQSDTQILINVLTKLQQETGNRRIKRSDVVNAMTKAMRGKFAFSSLVSRAASEGLVDMGASGGSMWVGLAKNNKKQPTTTDDGEQSSPTPSTFTSTPLTSSSTFPDVAAGVSGGEIYLSYRLLKNRANSQPILGIQPQEVQPHGIIDTIDADSRFVRRAFGPFQNEAAAVKFASSLEDVTEVVPRVIYYRPLNPQLPKLASS